MAWKYEEIERMEDKEKGEKHRDTNWEKEMGTDRDRGDDDDEDEEEEEERESVPFPGEIRATRGGCIKPSCIEQKRHFPP